ncbi:MAG: adenosylmethionine--8-amino-7-oxononanoate transaminase, partial [Gammaproteobacteria bacterium]|nr:adenosylmethionine--8-amino-7-oxononanoate transaminase [Gammaproteobacteria bacterium]
MTQNTPPKWLSDDNKHVWHPYSAIDSGLPVFPVESARGVRLRLADGRELIDGMASWWCAIHGYNHPVLNQAINNQLESMAHVMFGGLTHRPAVELVNKLVAITPESLQSVFLSDSGSVSVEVAMKMANQYWRTRGHNNKQKFLTVRGGYHGDTFGAMSVSDPVTGMHQLFADSIAQQFFVDKPNRAFGESCNDDDMRAMREALAEYQENIAAVILEPVVQGAGGMHFYSADYLNRLRALCDEFDVLLIFDEIATGFGRTGKLFALEHTEIVPDILCLGKSLTGGYMTLAATLTTSEVSQTISKGDPGLFMHGPTFMANPLACSVALASIELLLASPWQENVARIEQHLKDELEICASLDSVEQVRVLGAIGVVEMKQPVDMKT